MKKTLITTLLVTLAVGAFAQGTVSFVNNNGNSVAGAVFRANIFGVELGNPSLSKTGQTGGTDNPVGTQTYTGSLLAGSGFRAQLFAFNGAGQAEENLLAAPVTTTFRTGSAAGLMTGVTVTLAGVPKDAAAATFQVRVWDNSSGLYPDWATAAVAWQAGLIAAGKSALFNQTAIGGDLNTPTVLGNMQSFNIYVVPEPSTFVLAGLGAAALLIFRRRK